MIGNPAYNAEAYDVTCRVCDDWSFENITPTIAGTHLYEHSQFHSVRELGGPWWALRIVSGYEGTDPENPIRTADDGWNRSPTRTETDQ